MSSARLSRREQARFWAVAQAAKARGDLGESQIDVPLDVLGEDGLRPDLADDSRDRWPEVAGIALSPPLSGEAEWLAGIAGSEDMNAAAPSSAVEGGKLVPDRRRLQGRVLHPRHESGRRVGLPLDETHSAISGLGDGEAELEPAIAGAEGQAGEIAARAEAGM